MAAQTWPLTFSPKAPHFAEDSVGFDAFFDAVEMLGDLAGANAEDRKRWACRYAGTESAAWKEMTTYTDANATFDAFRVQVRACYPHLDDTRRFSFHDLQVLIRRTQSKTDMTDMEFGRYYRTFVAISGYLKTQQILSDKERGRRYLEGFPPQIRDSIARRLEITKSSVIPVDGYAFDDIHETATFVFKAGGADYRAPGVTPTPSAASSVASPTDSTSIKDLIQAMTQSFASALQQQQHHAPPSHPPPPRYPPPLPAPGGAPLNTPRWAPQPYANATSQGCVFCSAPEHYVRDCPVAAEYHKQGMLIKNEYGRIVLPDGRYPPRNIPGKNMKERIDRFWQEQDIQQNGPTVSTNFLETEDDFIFSINAALFDENDASEEPEDSSYDERIQVLQAQLNSLKDAKASGTGQKRVKFDGVELPKRTIGAPANRQPPKQAAPANPTILSRPQNPPPNQRSQGPMKPISMPPKPSDDHKFKYQSPIENSVKASDLVERTLDAQITLSTRELLAASAEVRRQVKELVSGKKVAAHSVEEVESIDSYLSTFQNDAPPRLNISQYDNAPAAVPSLPLRVIYPTFAPGVEPECILDGGAQIVVMRRDVWERLGVPITPSKAMVMESANSGTTKSLGLIENHPVRLGPVTVHLQIQVVEGAPFEVLLGRPFFAITNCNEISSSGGAHLIQLVDPKTKEQYVFPTHPRP